MRQLSFIVLLLLLFGITAADFELKDPSQESMEDVNASVSEAQGDRAVDGAGVKSCYDYQLDSKKNNPMHYTDLNWAKGFITGVNYIHTEKFGKSRLGTGLDLDALRLWIDNYCLRHPGETLAGASAALADELMN